MAFFVQLVNMTVPASDRDPGQTRARGNGGDRKRVRLRKNFLRPVPLPKHLLWPRIGESSQHRSVFRVLHGRDEDLTNCSAQLEHCGGAPPLAIGGRIFVHHRSVS